MLPSATSEDTRDRYLWLTCWYRHCRTSSNRRQQPPNRVRHWSALMCQCDLSASAWRCHICHQVVRHCGSAHVHSSSWATLPASASTAHSVVTSSCVKSAKIVWLVLLGAAKKHCVDIVAAFNKNFTISRAQADNTVNLHNNMLAVYRSFYVSLRHFSWTFCNQ